MHKGINTTVYSFYFLLFFVFFAINQSTSQTITNQNYFSSSIQSGLLISNSNAITTMQSQSPWGIEIDAGKILMNKEAYLICNSFISTGVSVKYHNFGSPNILGQSLTLALFAEPHIGTNKKLNASIKPSIGVNYLSKIHDSISNPSNIYFSSHLSFYLGLGLNVLYKLSAKTIILAGVSYNHISNSGLKQPNKGLNYPLLSVGYRYILNPQSYPNYENNNYFNDKKWHYYTYAISYYKVIKASASFSEINKWVFGTAFNTMRKLSKINAVGMGCELFYERAAQQANKEQNKNYNVWLFNPSVGHSFVFGKVHFSQQIHYSLSKQPYNENKFYQRYTLAYNAYKHLLLGGSIKARGTEAYQLDIRLGWLF